MTLCSGNRCRSCFLKLPQSLVIEDAAWNSNRCKNILPGRPNKTVASAGISQLTGAIKLHSQGDEHDRGNQNNMPRMPGEKSYCRHMRMQHGMARNPDRRKLGGLPVHSRGALPDLPWYRVYRARPVTSVATIGRKGNGDKATCFLVLYE